MTVNQRISSISRATIKFSLKNVRVLRKRSKVSNLNFHSRLHTFTHKDVFNNQKSQPAWIGSRQESDRSGFRVIDRAKGGTENPETLDRFAIPEDRREITHSY